MSNIKLKLTKSVVPIKLANANFAYVASPGTTPTIVTKAISDLSKYSNTEMMLANDATTYANVITFVQNNYTNTSSLMLSTLNDVDTTQKSNNSTLVYSSGQDKYIIKQLDLDGGNF